MTGEREENEMVDAPDDDGQHDGQDRDDDGAAGAGGRRRPAATDHERGLTGVLDALEEAVQGARSMPMSSSVLVSRAELLDLVAQARSVLPEQLAGADEILASADEVLAAARAQAATLLEDAEREAERLVGQEEVVRRAQERAARIVSEGEETAAELAREADDYCDRRLADFEIDLGKVLAQVQAGRAKLAARLDPVSREPFGQTGPMP